jgi:glycosyltransferase involved in cell wall biosynthesis
MKQPNAPARVRVLHVIQNLNYGGMERLLADIVRLTDPELIENHVLCLGFLGRFAEGLESHATLHVGPSQSRFSMLWPTALTRQIRGIAPDVVNMHRGVWYKTSLASKRAGVPWIIQTEHGREFPDPLRARLIDGLAARRTDVVVAVSELLVQQLAERRIVPSSKIRFIANGVDTDEYRPRPDTGKLRRELGISPTAPIVGSIGRMHVIKGMDVMVEAFARLSSDWGEGEKPVLVVGGEGPLRPELQERARVLGIADRTHLLGWRDDVHDLQSAFTIFALTSRSEGTSVSLLQAMSAELCPVVTDVGGNSAVLGPELGHRLVPSEDVEGIAAAWKAALQDEEARRRDARAGRERVLRNFGLEAMVQQYQKLYLEGVRGSRPSRRPGIVPPPKSLASVPRQG